MGSYKALTIVPITLRSANDFVAAHHRHNGRTNRNGGKFAIACMSSELGLVGVAIVGNPVSPSLMNGFTAEVTRLCTKSDAPKNVCSMLYAACWRAWKAMGGKKLITYTLAIESGASLRGAGWSIAAEVKPQSWHRPNIGRIRRHQSIYGEIKFRWEVTAATRWEYAK